MVVFVLNFGLFLILVFAFDKKNDWQVKQTLYLVKTLYSLLQFIFLIFLLPKMTSILSRSLETGVIYHHHPCICLPVPSPHARATATTCTAATKAEIHAPPEFAHTHPPRNSREADTFFHTKSWLVVTSKDLWEAHFELGSWDWPPPP